MSSESLSLHHEVQLPELYLLGTGKFRNAAKITADKSGTGGDTFGVAGIFPSAAPLLGGFAALGAARGAVAAWCLQTPCGQGRLCFLMSRCGPRGLEAISSRA